MAGRPGKLIVWLTLSLAPAAGAAPSSPDAPASRSSLTQGRLIHPISDGRIPVRLVANRVVGRWHGQDRHDVVGDAAKLGPNGVQDLHFSLSGLSPRDAIVKAVVTGHGADQWEFPARPNQNQYAAVIVRQPRSTSADLYVEPNRVETGREFCLKLTFSSGEVLDVYVKGGKADPNQRMPGASLAAVWVGQERFDFVGLGPSVGPDGLVDARLGMTRLSRNEKIREITLEDSDGARWVYGINKEGRNDADIYVDPKNPTQASLFIQPDRDFAGRKLKLTVSYEGGKSDATTLVGGKTNPKLAMAPIRLPKVTEIKVTSTWLGQDNSAPALPGAVHVALNGLTGKSALAGAVLTDGVRGSWVYHTSDRAKIESEPNARPLVLRRGSSRGEADLYFNPTRDETGATMTLRLVFQDGESLVASFPGGPADPARLAPALPPGQAVARPGDDLVGLVQRFGEVRLSPGNHVLTQPLVLPRPIRLVGEPGSVLVFQQKPGSPAWTTAIKIHSGGTTLKGFAVRFVGPIRWNREVSWGPAVIGTTDNLDNLPTPPKHGLVFEGLDLKGPEASRTDGWEEAVKLMRLLHVPGGRIVGNTLHGGTIEFFDGPWLIEKNLFKGTAAHTFSPSVFAAHDPHDMIVRGNTAGSEPGSGKTWRFLLLTVRGAADRVESNTISGIGPRDDDTIPSMNQPEIILTESYHLRFEGKPAAVSADGRLVKIHRLPGEAPQTGEVVSVLSGPGAGQWRPDRPADRTQRLLARRPAPRGRRDLDRAGVRGRGLPVELDRRPRRQPRGWVRSGGEPFRHPRHLQPSNRGGGRLPAFGLPQRDAEPLGLVPRALSRRGFRGEYDRGLPAGCPDRGPAQPGEQVEPGPRLHDDVREGEHRHLVQRVPLAVRVAASCGIHAGVEPVDRPGRGRHRDARRPHDGPGSCAGLLGAPRELGHPERPPAQRPVPAAPGPDRHGVDLRSTQRRRGSPALKGQPRRHRGVTRNRPSG
ncbi:MAG: hypothetical protein U0835_22805 [Isosphaeraceae bacterium]